MKCRTRETNTQLRAAAQHIRLRRRAAQAYLGISNTQFHKQIREGLLVEGCGATISGKGKVWEVGDLDRLMRARAAGWSIEKQKALVNEIHAARKNAVI